jgi:hypothetical protein
MLTLPRKKSINQTENKIAESTTNNIADHGRLLPKGIGAHSKINK